MLGHSNRIGNCCGDRAQSWNSVRPDELGVWRGHPELFGAFEGYYLESRTLLGTGPARAVTAVRVTGPALRVTPMEALRED
ncbi:MAG: hypothetical protein R2712_30315 [Vicinamibacterales bacterium]